MTQARLRIDIPEGPWIADLSRKYPEATFQVLTALPGDGEGFALVWIRSADIEDLLGEAVEHETMTEITVLERSETAATVQIETSAPMILLAAKRSGIPLEMPVQIKNGEATLDVAGAHDRLSDLGQEFESVGLSFEVEYIQERSHPDSVLTPRQEELLRTATTLGYYDTPRDCTLTELAEEVGLAKSTCSETLHRAEEKIVKRFIDELSPGTEREPEVIA